MAKGKKQRKPDKNESDSEDHNVESTTKIESKRSISKTKNAKSGAKFVDSASNSSGAENLSPVPTKKTQKSFALLQMSDSEEDNTKADKDVDSYDEDETQLVQKSTKATKKQGKKARRKRNDSDNEIEKALAELELEYSGAAVPKLEERDAEVDGKVQKKKEKKERQQQKKVAVETMPDESKELVNKKKKTKAKETTVHAVEPPTNDVSGVGEAEGSEEQEYKKKKKSKDKEKDDLKKPSLSKKMITAMQEALRKAKEEEERLQREEEERIRREEEAEQARLEAIRLEQERKEKKKQKEKERKERLKAEGKLLTAKQKADRARAQAMLESLKAQGVQLPEVGEKKPRLGTRIKTTKSAKKVTSKESSLEETERKETDVGVSELLPTDKAKEVEQVESAETIGVEDEDMDDAEDDNDVKDAWDASSSDGENSSSADESEIVKEPPKQITVKVNKTPFVENTSQVPQSKLGVDRVPSSELKVTKVSSSCERLDNATESLRAAIVCVLGHVDTGKTKILDKLRRTNVQDGEAGGITQQIGATNVPADAIKEQIKLVKTAPSVDIPGLLIIDTPGHESFSNLRSRGSSLCDIAILVVDIMHGLEPQTIESINLLKNRKTPFIVALNKIDRLYDWQSMGRKDVRDIMKAQAGNTQLEFDQRCKETIVQFAEQGMNAALFYENPDIRSYVSLVPTSAITGEGMGNLLAIIVDLCQSRLNKRLQYNEKLQATVLEVKALPGLGTTIDVILVNGRLRESDTMVCAGTDGPIVTQIRSILMPQPMKELRVKNAYIEYKEVKAAQGIKIAAKDLEKAIAGLNLFVAAKSDDIEPLKEVVNAELKSALSHIKLQERGVYVQASTLGSLEALLEFLKVSKIPYSGIRIGPVVKRDVMKASIMLEHESQYATILAFDVKIERDAQELADSLGVKIFQADIIYHLFDKFMAYREELRQKKRDEFKHIAVFPCRLKILPQYVFNSRDPIVVGVMVEAGIVKEGTPLCVPSKEFVDVGVVTSIENNHKAVECARKGMEVCIKIEPIPGESPKMIGRHFEITDLLVSKISRQSIDACKDYFRDDLIKTDWQLMVELKKLFQIM